LTTNVTPYDSSEPEEFSNVLQKPPEEPKKEDIILQAKLDFISWSPRVFRRIYKVVYRH
jgi:hypothetical protein